MTKEELQQLIWLKRNIKKLEERIEELEAAATRVTPVLSHEAKGGGEQDKISTVIAKIADVQMMINQKLHEGYEIIENIEKAIQNLPEKEKYLIRSRYIDCKSWEEIAVEMNYSWRGIHKIHSIALGMLRK